MMRITTAWLGLCSIVLLAPAGVAKESAHLARAGGLFCLGVADAAEDIMIGRQLGEGSLADDMKGSVLVGATSPRAGALLASITKEAWARPVRASSEARDREIVTFRDRQMARCVSTFVSIG